jgi:hypothetical protein
MSLHTGDGWQSGDASDERRLYTGDGWQSCVASDERRLNTGDGWQSGDASNDRSTGGKNSVTIAQKLQYICTVILFQIISQIMFSSIAHSTKWTSIYYTNTRVYTYPDILHRKESTPRQSSKMLSQNKCTMHGLIAIGYKKESGDANNIKECTLH